MSWKTTWLIIKREYLTRVKKKSFIWLTLLTPFIFLLFIAIVSLIFAYEGDEKARIAIIDESNLLNKAIPDQKNMYFSFPAKSLDELKEEVKQGSYTGILYLPEIGDVKRKNFQLIYYGDEQLPLTQQFEIEGIIRGRVRDYKLNILGIDKQQLEYLDTDINIEPEPVSEDAKDTSAITAMIGAGIGYFMGLIMFFITFFYGTFVMRGVFEEKVSRINELMISSVRPFELMCGKIFGIGAVGLTQIAIWAVLIPIVFIGGQLLFGIDTSSINQGASTDELIAQMEGFDPALIMQEIMNQDWWFILPMLIIYFLGGYLIYSSLFAAVGSAMGDDMNEGQTLTLPITLPVILAVYIAMSVLRSPNSTLAVWASIFPFFSPIVMPARLAFSPPWWEVALSVGLLIAGAIFCIWIAARIYRVGILMYGKKATFKELGKWLFYKD